MKSLIDPFFYKKAYKEMENKTILEIKKEWILNGIRQNKLPSKKYFYIQFPNFNWCKRKTDNLQNEEQILAYHWDLFNTVNNCNVIINMYYKINYVDCILWINLDSAIERKILTECNLSNIKINNIRIPAIDAKKKQITPEYACVLSHIKAINKAKELQTKYCLIIEDDVDFSNLNIFPWTIEDVIKNAPEFDILIISKTFNYELDNLYTSWNEMKNNNKFIKGAIAYIVTDKFVEHFVSKCACFANDEFTIYNSHNMDYSENYLYTNVKSIVYKYNVVYQTSNDSTIQNKMLSQYKINNEFQKNIIKIDFPETHNI